MKILKKIINFILASNRLKHFYCGILVGAGANDWYSAAYAGAGVAAALEFKDYQWGGKPDIIDFAFTVAGVAIGHAIRACVAHFY